MKNFLKVIFIREIFMRKNFWKTLTIGTLCAAALLSCVACGKTPGGNPGTPDDDPINGDVDTTKAITLKIQSAAPLRYNYAALLRSEAKGSQLYNQALFSKQLVEGFKVKYPNITLRFIEDGWGDALYEKQQLYIRDYNAGGTMAVDVMIGETYMGYFAKNNVFTALDKSKFENVIESACADVTINDAVYAVPMCTGIMGLQYNTQILQEAGIPEEEWVPANWDELLENCKKVSEYAVGAKKDYRGICMNNVTGLPSAFRAVPFLRQGGGDIMTNGELTVNSAQNVETFTYLRNLASYAYPQSLTAENEDTVLYYFTEQNKSAYLIDGQWAMANAEDHIKSAPLPTKNADGTGTGNIFTGNVLFGITRASKNKEAAQAFLEYLTSSEVQGWFYELDGRLPINKTTLQSEEIREVHPNINAYIDALNAGGFQGGMACFTRNSNDIWSAWGSFYRDVLTGSSDIKTLADNLQTTIKGKM